MPLSPARSRAGRLAAAVLLPLPLLVAGSATAAAAPVASTVAAASTHGCPSARLAARADRPQVSLQFTLSSDKSYFNGAQAIVFTPDKATGRIVLRQWANMPDYRAAGTSSVISKVQISGAVSKTVYPSDNRSTLLSITLPRTLAAGERVTISTTFTVRLAKRGSERIGSDARTAWWGSAHPMLAWEYGVGWATDPAGTLWGERTTSESFYLRRLIVRTKATDVVLSSGTKTKNVLRSDGRRDHYFVAPSIRDVMVAAGPLRQSARTVRNTRLIVAAAPNVSDRVGAVLDTFARSLDVHTSRFGTPFPYPTLSVVVLPRLGGGIEFPGAIMMGSGEYRDGTATHEVGHEYFYGLVGNNQGRDPWLDEAFATYAEALHRGTSSTYLSATAPSNGYRKVGAPMSYWESRQSSYYRSVYVQGARALLLARRAAGATAFDAAIRCYVRSRAHRIARPAHLAAALDHLPEARRVLVYWGALPSIYAP